MPRVVVAGASGLIGTALVASLRGDGIDVTTLVRHAPTAAHPAPAEGGALHEVHWLDGGSPLDPHVLAGAHAAVVLNGASIGRFPWTASYRRTLLDSRIAPTTALATAVRALGDDAPKLVSASAVGFYGTRPPGRVTESSPAGGGFLAEMCVHWETAARAAGEKARVAYLRTAPVVHRGGVLKPLIVLTKLGLSGPIGRGTQVWPWISLEDEVRAVRHVIDADLTGPVNLTGPTRATANDLGFALARRMNRPFLLRAPVPAMKLLLGADAVDSLLTTDADVAPAALEASGFRFEHPTVESAVDAAIPA